MPRLADRLRRGFWFSYHWALLHIELKCPTPKRLGRIKARMHRDVPEHDALKEVRFQKDLTHQDTAPMGVIRVG